MGANEEVYMIARRPSGICLDGIGKVDVKTSDAWTAAQQ